MRSREFYRQWQNAAWYRLPSFFYVSILTFHFFTKKLSPKNVLEVKEPKKKFPLIFFLPIQDKYKVKQIVCNNSVNEILIHFENLEILKPNCANDFQLALKSNWSIS